MRGLRRRVGGRSSVALLLPVLVVAIVLMSGGVALADQWTDIPDSTWQNTYGVTAAQAATVSDGYTDGTFRPTQPVTRGQFAKFAVEGFGIAKANPTSPTFRDVARGSTFYVHIEGGAAAGVLSGYTDGTYKPNSTIRRQQANNILGSYLSKKELSEKSSITGSKGVYQSLKAWYEAEGRAILAQFRDGQSVADVHAPGTAYLVYRQVVLGSGSGANLYLTPDSSLTRAQAVVMVLRVKSATFASSYTADMTLALTAPAADANNTISISGTGGARTATVNVVNGTTSVVLTGLKSAAQTVLGGGADKNDVTAGGTATAQTYTVNTSSISSGGSKTFTLTLGEEGKTSIVYSVTVNVAIGLNLVLTTPVPSATNTISFTGSLAAPGVNVRVVNGTNAVVLSGTKSSTQIVTIGGPHSALVALGGTPTSPTYTVDTSAVAVEGGARQFTLTLSEPGKTSILYTVTVTVGPEFELTLTTPTANTENTLAFTGSATAWDVDVKVKNGTSSVVLTGSKSANQLVAVGGTNQASVTATGTVTAPVYTIDTNAIKDSGGTRVFTLTLKETGKADVVFNVTVTVRALTAYTPWDLTVPTKGTYNTIENSGVKAVRRVDIKVANATTGVVLTASKASTQMVTVGGLSSGDVSSSGSATLASMTVNTTSVAVKGGQKQFTITVAEANKTSIIYTVTITVAGLTDEIGLSLTTPTASPPNNTLTKSGADAAFTVNVTAATANSTVVLTGSKKNSQALAIGGTNAADVSVGGSSIAPVFNVNTSSIAAAGGTKTFTITVSEIGVGNRVYAVTVTVLGPLTAEMSLSLTTPTPGAGNKLEPVAPHGTGMTRTIDVTVVSGVASVVLTGTKNASQTVTVGGTNASNVTVGGNSTVPTYTINTSTVSTGGERKFTLTLSETGKTSILYNVTVTVSGLTDPMTEIKLADPLPDDDNKLTEGGSGASRTLAVNVVTDTDQVAITGVKKESQTVTVGGINAGDVTPADGGTTASFAVDTDDIAETGGTRVFTITLSEVGKGSIVYSVTVTVANPFTGPLNLTLFSPTPGGGNSLTKVEEGGTRPVQVNVQNGTTSVVLHSTKTTAQTLTKGGTDASNVSITGAATTTPVITVNTTTVSAGGSKRFTLKMTETGKTDVIYDVTVTVGGTTAPMALALTTPAPDADNALYVAGSGATRTVTVNVQNGANPVVIAGTKLATQGVTVGGTHGGSVTPGGTATNPTYSVNTSAVATSGGEREFTLTLTEPGQAFITYTVTVNVAVPYTAHMAMDLTSPTGEGNGPPVITDASASHRTFNVNVVNGITSVVLTGTKTTAQTVTKVGDVTIAGGTTETPTFTVNTSAIATTGGTKSFTLTIKETGKSDRVYTVVVTVGSYTQEMDLELTTPAEDENNTITTSGTGGTRTVAVNVENATESVVLTGTKAWPDQTVTIGGPNGLDVTVAGGATMNPQFTVDMESVAEAGGTKTFTLTLSRSGEASIEYTVTVNVAMAMTFSLTSPSPGTGNELAGGGTDTTVTVDVVNGIGTVVITGTKGPLATVTKGGTDQSYVTIGGSGTAPTFTVNTASIASVGGTRTFTLTLTEAGKGSIVYTVTVTVAGLTEEFDSLVLTAPTGAGNSRTITGTGATRTVTVNVVNDTDSVLLTAAKTVAQTVTIDGVNKLDVTPGGTDVAPTFTVNTSLIAASGGSKVFTLTLSEPGTGKGSIVYNVTVTVAAP